MYLIIGASSFIGSHLFTYCKKYTIDVCGTYFNHSANSEWIKFDICTQSLEEFKVSYFNNKIIDAIIICSANSSIDDCKRNSIASHDLNVNSIKKILDQAKKLGIKCVFLSSEAVFDGLKGMYSEKDVPNPITIYGKQKLMIENYILNNLEDYLIFRISRAVSSCFGENDIFKEFYDKILKRESIICLQHQSFCATEVNDIAEMIIKSLEMNITGLFHLSSDNYMSRYELANLYAEKVFGSYDKIIEKEYAEIAFLDNRHIYGGLKGAELTKIIPFNYMGITEILDNYVYTMQKKKAI